MIRVASIPSRDDNRYLELFYRALEPHGVELIHDFRLTKNSLLKHRAAVDVIHIQWCPEQLWRWGGMSFGKQLRGVVGLWKDLRLAKRLGMRIVWTCHDIESHEGSRLLDRLGYRVLARAADLVIGLSPRVPEEVVRRYGGDPARMLVLPHGNYDGTYPAPGPKAATLAGMGLPDDRKTLLCFGGIRQYKGFEVAVEALRLLDDGYQLIIAGYPLEARLGDDLRGHSRGLNNVALKFKRLSQQEIADLAHAADCVVLPYRRITGSGALLTAVTLARGVVASDHPFFRETLALEPDAGVLCTPGDASAFARGIREFFNRPAESRNAAARRLADRFSWDDIILPFASWLKERFPERQGVSQPAFANRGS